MFFNEEEITRVLQIANQFNVGFDDHRFLVKLAEKMKHISELDKDSFINADTTWG
jgi:hypothetical protein